MAPGPLPPDGGDVGQGPGRFTPFPGLPAHRGAASCLPPLAREVPPPPTLLSPRAINCAQDIGGTAATTPLRRGRRQIYCGQQTRNSDERAQERDKDQGEPASEHTAPPHPIPRPTHHQPQNKPQHEPTAPHPDRTTPYL